MPARASEIPAVLIVVSVACPLAGSKRRVQKAGEDGSGGPRLGGRPGGALDLRDDLVLPDGHRVQPTRD